MARQLRRSKSNRMIAGVCGGLGEYLEVDPVLVRLLLVVATLMGGSGIILYLVAWVLIPEEA